MRLLDTIRAGLGAALLVLPLALISGCSGGSDRDADSSTGNTLPAIIQAPAIAQNPNPWVPLAAVIDLATDVPTRVELEFSDGRRTWSEVAVKDYRTVHDDVPVLGMTAGRDHSVQVTVREVGGTAFTWPTPLAFTTPALPADFPPVTTKVSEPPRMEPGVRLVTTIRAPALSRAIMLDAEGEVVWYLDASLLPQTVGQNTLSYPMPNGNLLLMVDRFLLIEVDRLGNVLSQWFASNLATAPPGTIPVAVDSFHHDVIALPPGAGADFVVLSTEKRTYANYPADVVNTSSTNLTADVVGDVVVEFDRDGTIVRRIKLLDVLDPYRVTYGSLDGFYDNLYQQPTHDWTHGNGIGIDPRDEGYVLSLRHQDAVVKVDRFTGQLRWILGDPRRWNSPWSNALLTPSGLPFEWNFHQHDPNVSANGEVLMYDNGNGRAIPPQAELPEKERYSRAAEFLVDENAMTAQQTFSFGLPPETRGPSFYSFFVSGARRMPTTGNVMVCDGGRQVASPAPRRFARVLEVTRQVPPEVVYEVWIDDPDLQTAGGTSAYRSYLLSGVYPD